MKNAYNHYNNSYNYNLNDVYGNFSGNKQRAFNYCVDLMDKYNGTNGKIIGYNSNVFSYGFEIEKDNKKYFAYITKTYNRICQID